MMQQAVEREAEGGSVSARRIRQRCKVARKTPERSRNALCGKSGESQVSIDRRDECALLAAIATRSWSRPPQLNFVGDRNEVQPLGDTLDRPQTGARS
jgi:hypothetical protein